MESIEYLKPEEWKILKQIVIITTKENSKSEIGRIYYTRPLCDDYNLLKSTVNSQKDNDTKGSILKNFDTYPKQNDYPEDDLDRIILQSVQNSFKDSTVINDLILLNADLEKIRTLKNRIAISATLYFSPKLEDCNPQQYIGQSWTGLIKKLTVYSNKSQYFLSKFEFSANYPASYKSVLDKLHSITFG